MSAERIRELWARALSGSDLSPAERQELLGALQGDERLRREFLDDVEMHGALRARVQSDQHREDFLRAVSIGVGATDREGGFLRKLETRIQKPKTTRRIFRGRRVGLGPALAAAGVLLAVAAAIVLFTSRPTPQNPIATPKPPPRVKDKALPPPAPQEKPEDPAPARAERERMERELAKREEERRQVVEDLKRAADAQEQMRLKDLEAEIEKIADDFRRKLRSVEKPVSEPAKPTQTPERPPEKERTQLAVANVEEVEGEAFVVGKNGKTPARKSMDILPGQGLETAGGQARVTLSFGDRTLLKVEAETHLSELRAEGGKRVFIEKGVVLADVVPQRKDQPMVFAGVVGEATVRGTTLRLLVDPDPKKGMRLDVEEGKVDLKRLADQKTVTVVSGHYAVAAVGVDLAPKRLPISEILLTARQARISGIEWNFPVDPKASTGRAFETRTTSMKGTFPPPQDYKESNCVTFEFNADADQDYSIWIRARTIAKEIAYKTRGTGDDAFVIEIPEATLGGDIGSRNATLLNSPQRAFYDGYCNAPGYSWIGGAENSPSNNMVAVTARFPRPGRQILRVYGVEPPVRIDAIWLSTTQKTRPEPGSFGPLNSGRK